MVIKRDMRYTPNGKNRPLHIYLPEGCFSGDERYPVMYFFDGHNLFSDSDATYGKSWGLARFLDAWDKPMIIVGMECGHEGAERLSEYSPYSFTNRFMGEVTGTGEETFRWIIDEVKPMIDREYPTWSHREATGIGGSSMGGLMSVYGALHHADVFSKAACLSSAIASCMPQVRAEVAAAALPEDVRMYLSYGTRETSPRYSGWMARVNNELTASLKARGVQTLLFRQEGGRHCEADWEPQIPLFMDFLWK